MGIWSASHFIKQMIAESGLTPHSATTWPLWTLLYGQSVLHTFEQPADLLDTPQTQTLHNHLLRIHFRAKRSLPGLPVHYRLFYFSFFFLSHYIMFYFWIILPYSLGNFLDKYPGIRWKIVENFMLFHFDKKYFHIKISIL